ncbi:MAG: VCBS repeat-containing protein [SAR202 cluster bacterium]|nr:VCBS repeat-containing protein [SAR202 cluster bacterium]
MTLLENVGRVACAEAADFDRDGDLDIAVCVFGNNEGKVVWLEQKPGMAFEEHVIDPRPGAIHAFPFDADRDGDADIAVSLSQDFAEVLLYRNNGAGVFAIEVLFKAAIKQYGMSGI